MVYHVGCNLAAQYSLLGNFPFPVALEAKPQSSMALLLHWRVAGALSYVAASPSRAMRQTMESRGHDTSQLSSEASRHSRG